MPTNSPAHRRLVFFFAAAFLLAPPSRPRLAAQTTADIQKLQSEIDALTSQVKQLKAQVAAQPKAAKATGKSSAAKTAASGGTGSGASAPGAPSMTDTTTIKGISTAFAVPTTPAAAVLGISPNNVQHVQTPKQFIPQVLSGMDDKGHFKSGFAIDYAPFQSFWAGAKPSDIASNQLALILTRTQISFASVKGTTSADQSTKIALGIHSVLIASNDPLGNVITKDLTDDSQLKPLRLRLNEFAPVSEDTLANLNPWTHSNLSVGAAPSWTSANNGEGSYTYNGTTAWGSYAYTPTPQVKVDADDTRWFAPALRAFNGAQIQAVASVLYHDKEKAPATDSIDKTGAAATAASPQLVENSLFVVGGIQIGWKRANILFTGGHLNESQEGHGGDTAWRYGGTLEALVDQDKNIWVDLSLEQDSGHKDGRNPTIISASLKYGFDGTSFASVSNQ